LRPLRESRSTSQLHGDAPREEAVQENALICQFFLPTMRVGLMLYIKYRA